MLRIRLLLVFLAGSMVLPSGGAVTEAAAQSVSQTIPFGSADDPREQIQRQWWRRENFFYAMGGVSLIAAQWRGATSMTLDLVTRPVTARLKGTVRAGFLGEYEPDLDEPYDLLRLVSFARYNPPRNRPVHVRAGLIDRMRLGVGHVVNFFNSSVAWDERTVGGEFIRQGRTLEMAGFTDNVLMDGVLGGRVAVRPLAWSRARYLQSAQLGLNYVTDRSDRPPETPRLEAFNVDLQLDLFSSGNVFFAPFASYAWYPDFGDGLAFGADLYSLRFLDLLSFRFRLGLFYNSKRFIPGYVGAFYTVNSPQARILKSGSDLTDIQPDDLAGVALGASRGANDLLTEFKMVIFDGFELWYYFRHHFGLQRLSEFHLRLFLRSSDQLRIEIGIDRNGLGGLFTIFNDLDDQSALVFGTDYRMAGPLYLYLRARYSFERIGDDDTAPRYLVQRRFEPFTGLRFRF